MDSRCVASSRLRGLPAHSKSPAISGPQYVCCAPAHRRGLGENIKHVDVAAMDVVIWKVTFRRENGWATTVALTDGSAALLDGAK